jgi:hypothetical protein
MADRESCIGPEAAADYVQTEAPRLIKVAGATAISFGLWDGANRTLSLANQEDVHDDAWQTALGYRGDTISLTVVRLALLLDRDPTVVSFQRIYNYLKRPDVVDLLVYRACHASELAKALDDRVADDVRASTKRFLETYTAIDWHDLHGRLQHFRNRGLVHLTTEQIEKRVSYAEIRSLVHSVTVLAECLLPFDPNLWRFVSMKSMIGVITRNWYGRRHSEPLASFLTKGRCSNARLPQISLCNGPARHGETHDLCRIMGGEDRAQRHGPPL